MRRLGELVNNRLHQGFVAGARTVRVEEAYVPLHEQVETLHIPRAYTPGQPYLQKRAVTEREAVARMSCVDCHIVIVIVIVHGPGLFFGGPSARGPKKKKPGP